MMTEKDLYRYKHAVLEERRRRLLLLEHEERLNALKSPSAPSVPSGSDGSGKIAADLDRLERCRAKLKEAISEVSLAEMLLEAARKCLDDRECRVFDVLYYGYTEKGVRVFPIIRVAAKKLNYSPSAIYSIRHRILEKIAPIPA